MTTSRAGKGRWVMFVRAACGRVQPRGVMTVQSQSQRQGSELQLVLYPFACVFALQLFGRFSDQLGLAGFLTRVAHVWRAFTHQIWADLFSWFHLSIPTTPNQFDGMTISAILLGAVMATPLIALLTKKEVIAAASGSISAARARGAVFFFSYWLLVAVFLAPYWPNLATLWVDVDRSMAEALPSWIRWINVVGNFFAMIILALAVFAPYAYVVARQIGAQRSALLWSIGLVIQAVIVAVSIASPLLLDTELRERTWEAQREMSHMSIEEQFRQPWIMAAPEQVAVAATIVFLFSLAVWAVARFNPMSLPRMMIAVLALLIADRLIDWFGPLWAYLNLLLQRVGG